MKQYTVEWSSLAENDAKSAYWYIAIQLDAPMTAAQHYQAFDDEADKLAHSAEIYRVFFIDSKGTEYRRVFVNNYELVYVIHEDRVVISRVLHQSEDVENILD
jgi:plasmid stabilization system protein ParE